MVIEVNYQYLFKYPVEMVTNVHLNKYHTGKDTNVLSIDTVEKTTDFNGQTYYKRIANCKNVIPRFLRQISFLNEQCIQLEEECWVHPEERTLHIKSRNITWYKYAQLWERSSFKPLDSNPNWTTFKQEGQINMESFGRFGSLLEKFSAHFLRGGVQKSWKIMEEILAEQTPQSSKQETATGA